MGFIYKITNKITGKCYIGETTADDPQKRWSAHIHTMKSNKGCPALKDAMKKHGVENFKFEVIIICFDEDVNRYEQEYIKKYNSMTPNGYNILAGGQCGGGFKGKTHTPETITKILESKRKFREANPNHFETYREKHRRSMEKVDISAAMRNSEKFQKAKREGRLGGASHEGGKLSDETKIKIRDSVLRYYRENDGNTTINIEERREIMKRVSGKSIIQYNISNEVIREYDSIAEAGRLSGVKRTNISSALCRNSATAGGFIWRYAPKTT